jgi:ribosome-associated protein
MHGQATPAPLSQAVRIELESRPTHRDSVKVIQIQLKGEYVRLCDLLRLAGIADSGGQGKLMVAEGEVTVDGQPESRKTAKIRAGQTVECRGVKIVVTAK